MKVSNKGECHIHDSYIYMHPNQYAIEYQSSYKKKLAGTKIS